ncbi:MAG: Calx-beta domain-containing protein, partial [Alphaproteobacteria bacterium]
AVPFGTVDTNPAQPGVDLAAGNFEFSTDGGLTWHPAGGPNGTRVTFEPGQTALQVRIDTFADGVLEGDESVKLVVANKDEIGHCDVPKIVEGYGYIFDTGDCQPPPEWFVCGPPCLIEAVDPPYTVGISELALQAGQTRSIDVKVEFTSFHTGHDAASFADFGGRNFLFNALRDAAEEETGITVQNLGNGAVRVTFASNASTNQLEFDIFPVSDTVDEKVEDFRIVIENSQATNGAQPGVVVPGESTSFVESHIVESDEYMVTIGNARADEGDPLVFAVSLSNPHTDEPLTLDLAAISGGATAGVDFEAFGFEYSTDGGATWNAAGGPDGNGVTFEAGETELLVRIESFPDSLNEGNESFRLTVADQDELGPCDLSGVEDGKGVIVDVTDCAPPPCEPPPCDPPPKD